MVAFWRLWGFSGIFCRVFFIFFTFFPVASSDAQDFGRGLLAYDSGNYEIALYEFTRLADEDHAESQYYIGLMHEGGQGVPQDIVRAMDWYSKAALQGFAEGGYRLGIIYEEGRGMPKEVKKAAFWYMRADALGSMEGKTRLAMLYMTGKGLERDVRKAKQLLTVAAEADYPEAQYIMGWICEQGIEDGTTQAEPKKREALIWYGRAAEKGHEKAIAASARLRLFTTR